MVDKKKRISHIIVTWNNESIIEECIDTLMNFSNFENEIIIVDNNSSDDTCKVIKRKYNKKIILLEMNTNLGFSMANNVGLMHSTGEYVFFVNPDVIFIEDILTRMVAILEQNSDVGIVSPQLLYKDMSYQVSSCNFPSASKVFWDDMHAYILLNDEKKKLYAQAQYKVADTRFVDWTYGAAQLCRRDDVIAIGGFPEGYFMYGEDTEFCMIMLSQLQKKTLYYGQCKLIHLGGYSEKQVLNSKKIVYGTKAAMRFVDKYYGKMALIRYRCMLFVSSFIKYLWYVIKSVLCNQQKNINGKVKWKASWRTVLKYDKR